mmetsp:Transcript_46406/g.54226  ORF Transcript_46406/g.54226 Transcript_46406/m.54226 type:complete len:208 (+) Transcript_46406:682-1305(+)
MMQGDLTDPLYFDFISFAQYRTIYREISDPSIIFEESQGQDMGEDMPQKFVSVIVKRDPRLKNEQLPAEHSRLVGESILNRIYEIFAGTKASIPSFVLGSRPPSNDLLSVLSQLVNIFVISGFAFDGEASISRKGSSKDSKGTEFTIIFSSPATLWSGKSLKILKSNPANDFFLKTARALIFRAGYSLSNVSVDYKGTQEITVFTTN